MANRIWLYLDFNLKILQGIFEYFKVSFRISLFLHEKGPNKLFWNWKIFRPDSGKIYIVGTGEFIPGYTTDTWYLNFRKHLKILTILSQLISLGMILMLKIDFTDVESLLVGCWQTYSSFTSHLERPVKIKVMSSYT